MPVSPSKTQHHFLAWLVTLTAALFFFYGFIQLNLFSAINAPLMQEFGLTASQLGQLASMYFYGNALFLIPAGLLLDRYSTKKLLLSAIVLSTIGTFAFAWSPNYLMAATARFFVGISAAFCFLSSIRLASRWFPANRMALVTGIVVTMAMIGGMVAQTPMTVLSNNIGWRNATLIDAALGIIVFIATLIVVKDRPSDSHDAAKADKEKLKALGLWRSLIQTIVNPQNWLGGIYASLLNLPVFLLGALWGINYLTEVHHISAVQASYATTLFFVGVIFGSPAYGWFSDHIGLRRLPMIVGAIISLAVILVLMYVPNLSLGSLIALFFLIGFTTSSQVLAYPTIAELNPISLTSTAISIASMTIMSSGFIFQPLFGWMMEWQWDKQVVNGLPIYSPQDFNHAMWIIPLGFIAGLIVSLFIKETNCRSIEFVDHHAQNEMNKASCEATKSCTL
jgi:MFS family permease